VTGQVVTVVYVVMMLVGGPELVVEDWDVVVL
jgi:hypothetical protein